MICDVSEDQQEAIWALVRSCPRPVNSESACQQTPCDSQALVKMPQTVIVLFIFNINSPNQRYIKPGTSILCTSQIELSLEYLSQYIYNIYNRYLESYFGEKY